MPTTDDTTPVWYPRAFTAPELALVDVKVLSLAMQLIECLRCGQRWKVERGPRWWACPMGCNARLG